MYTWHTQLSVQVHLYGVTVVFHITVSTIKVAVSYVCRRNRNLAVHSPITMIKKRRLTIWKRMDNSECKAQYKNFWKP